MNTKMLGGILLLVGTSMGGGMLALPVSTAPSGFIYSTFLLFACWALMTFCAFLILEVNLWLPEKNNIISMAKATLGPHAALIAWFSYLLLFYCLLAAYISSGTDILHNLIGLAGIHIPTTIAALLFVFLLGSIIYKGVRAVDYMNRGLMFAKLGSYAILVSCVVFYTKPDFLIGGEAHYLWASVTVIITSFGSATIIPSLRVYYRDDVAQLRKTILIGSLIPLACYILWDLAILGTLPRTGEDGLLSMMTSGHSTTDIPHALSHYLQNTWITLFARIFTSVCVATSFLGVSLGMSDFLADGWGIEKKGTNQIWIYGATFGPPIILSLFYPNAFIKGLSYAGVFCTLLLALFPALMAWSGRYHTRIARGYAVMGGKGILVFTAALSIVIMVITIVQDLL